MAIPNDAIPIEHIELMFNTVVAPQLKEDAQETGMLSYYINLETTTYGKIKPNPQTIDDLKEELRDLDFEESLIYDQMVNVLQPKDGDRKVVMIMVAPRGSHHLSAYSIKEEDILGNRIYMGDRPQVTKENQWFSDKIKTSMFESIVDQTALTQKLLNVDPDNIALVVLDSQDNMTLKILTFDQFENILARERLLGLDFSAKVKSALDKGEHVIIFAMENYLILYPMLITYKFEGNEFQWTPK